MDPYEKQLIELQGHHKQLKIDFDYHKREFEEVKKELKSLGVSLNEISQSIKMIKYIGWGALAMYFFQSTGSISHFAKLLFAV